MHHELIRPQVVEHRRKRLLGEVVLTRSHRGVWPLASIIVLMALLMVWAALARFNRIEDVAGYVVSDKMEVNIVSSRHGVVQQMLVKEGDDVTLDQPLAYVASDFKNHDLGSVSAATLDALGKQRDNARHKRGLLQSVANSGRERLQISLNAALERYAALGRQRALQESLVNSLIDTLHRFSTLVEVGLVSKLELERRQQEVMMARQRLEEISQAQSEADSAITIAKFQIQSHAEEVELQLTQSQMEIDGLNKEFSAMSADAGYAIVAPVSGTVTLLQATQGKTVDVRYPLFTIRPAGAQFEVELLAPSKAVGFLEVGQSVNVMYDAFPYQKFGASSGIIARISDSAVSPRDIDSKIEIDEPVYKIRVRLNQQYVEAYGAKFPLHGGMTVRASIVLDKRSFVDWLLEPINAVRGRL